ncbi:hypothetical protein [Flagellimonas sp.]|uniref:hypothetical protein n=1 Tax=Flagellimonas sp. TaxID=2058762 RepID=UPI003BA9392E
MQNLTYIIILMFSQIFAFGQNLNGTYSWSGEVKGPKSDYGTVVIEITSDSTYTQTDLIGYKSDFKNNENQIEQIFRKGKIKKDGGFYILTEIGNRKNWMMVKIRSKKLIVYGYELKKNGKMKKVRGIELEKAGR